MKNIFFWFIIFLNVSLLTSCSQVVKHTDSFYNYNDSEFPRDHLPVLNPVEATRERPNSPWSMELLNVLWIDLPKVQEQDILEVYSYSRIEELEKFAVEDGVILAYSAYVDQQADPYVQDDFYHWFVMDPSEDITEGFHTEDEFNQYIQSIGIQNPEWQTPDDAFDQFLDTGCLDWFPDCE